MSKSLPIFQESASSLRADGSRNYVHPADVSGRFTSIRHRVFAVLLVVYMVLPWIEIAGHPAVFFDIAARRFFLFGKSFNAQDIWLLFFLLTGIGFALFVITAVWGRLWCGYACPQTVFLEGVFRRIERWIEGPRNARLKRNAGPWNRDKVVRKLAKHSLFVLIAAILAHVLMSYFVSMPGLLQMIGDGPGAHLSTFLWTSIITVVIYFNFAWFREQLCLIICPYGRLQSVLTDRDTLIIGYDEKRGEPRGKKGKAEGDCIDCGRCVAVCPTGIDIRGGLQIDCIGCANCIDACDEIMEKVGRPKGLIRYDSLRGLTEGVRQMWRPRLTLYAVLAVAGLVAATLGVGSRQPFAAQLLRLGQAPFLVESDGRVQNLFELHLVNKGNDTRRFTIEGATPDVEYIIGMPEVELAGGGSQRVPVFVYFDPKGSATAPQEVEVVVLDGLSSQTLAKRHAPFLHPR